MTGRGRVLICLGSLLIAAAIVLTGYNLYDGYQAGKASEEALRQIAGVVTSQPQVKDEEEKQTNEMPDRSEAAQMESGEDVKNQKETSEENSVQEIVIPDYVLDSDKKLPVKIIDGVEYIGTLTIPALERELPVITAWTKWNLRKAPCRYSGSPYRGDMIIAGHNYPAHFQDLKDLREGDLAIFTDMDGNIFYYEMMYMEILRPAQVDDLKSGDWDLTLFTCTSDWRNRVVVRFCEVKFK